MAKKGKFIDVATAKKQINAYVTKVLPKLGVKEEDGVIGNMFDLNEIKAFIQRIDDFNNRQKEGDKIDSIRIYNGWNDDAMEDDKCTVFLIPVKAGGEDIYPVYNDSSQTSSPGLQDEDVILGEPTPCPNFCKITEI